MILSADDILRKKGSRPIQPPEFGLGRLSFSLGVVLCMVWLIPRVAADWDRVTLEPKETDGMLANPGMGWQTFHTFADEDPTLGGIPSSSAYFRFYWREIEPEQTKIDFVKLDQLLAHARRASQKLCFRIMCTGSGEYSDTPQYVRDAGCKGYEFEYAGAKHWVPSWDDPVFRQHHFRVIRTLGSRYGHHPDVDLIDIGTVGLWGEWHMSGTTIAGTNAPVPLPVQSSSLSIIEAWRWAFPTKPKVMQIGNIEGLKHAVRNGTGWRADCLGDMGGFSKNWNHMRDLYPTNLVQASATEAWKRGPVAFESCWDIRRWKQEGWDIRLILDYALSNHVSYCNNKSAPIPDDVRPEVERFVRKMGYRLVLRKLDHDRQARPGECLTTIMQWENIGVAPPYGAYVVAFRLGKPGLPASSALVSVGQNSIRGWIPGAKKVVELILLPATLSPGTYDLSLALVDQKTQQPAIKLGIEGQGEDGWYKLSKVDILEAPPAQPK